MLAAPEAATLGWMPVIRLREIVKAYGATRALDGVSAEFPAGATGLLGPNGAGKTTLLKTLLGLLPPDGGRAEVLGIDPAAAPLDLRARVGYMPETDGYIPRLSGVRFVAFAGELAGLDRRSALTRGHEVLHYVGLGEARYRKVDDYSQGMRQRLRLAQAIVHDPDLLFLDEPTSGLDPSGRTEMLALIADLAGRHGKHLVLSTHLLPDVEEVCASVVVLRAGRVAGSGPLETLLAGEHGVYQLRIRGPGESFLARLAERGIDAQALPGGRVSARAGEDTRALFASAREARVQIRELEEVTSTLEEAFLRVLDEREEA